MVKKLMLPMWTPKIILIVAFLLTISCFSCHQEKCDDTRDFLSIYDSKITIEYINDQSGNLIIRDSGGEYAPTDVIVYNGSLTEMESVLYPRYLSSPVKEYLVAIPILTESKVQYNLGKEYSYRVYVDLKGERDTIDYKFKIRKLECTDQLEYLAIKYNDKEVLSVNDVWQGRIQVIK